MTYIFPLLVLLAFHAWLPIASAASNVKSIGRGDVDAKIARITGKDKNTYSAAGRSFVPAPVRAMAASSGTTRQAARMETVQEAVMTDANGEEIAEESLDASSKQFLSSLRQKKARRGSKVKGCKSLKGPGYGTCMSPARLGYTVYPFFSKIAWQYKKCPCKCLYRCGVFKKIRFCYLICGGRGYLVFGFGPNFCCFVWGHSCKGSPGFDSCPTKMDMLCSAP